MSAPEITRQAITSVDERAGRYVVSLCLAPDEGTWRGWDWMSGAIAQGCETPDELWADVLVDLDILTARVLGGRCTVHRGTMADGRWTPVLDRWSPVALDDEDDDQAIAIIEQAMRTLRAGLPLTDAARRSGRAERIVIDEDLDLPLVPVVREGDVSQEVATKEADDGQLTSAGRSGKQGLDRLPEVGYSHHRPIRPHHRGFAIAAVVGDQEARPEHTVLVEAAGAVGFAHADLLETKRQGGVEGDAGVGGPCVD